MHRVWHRCLTPSLAALAAQVSGTPIQNDMIEFFSLLDFCIPRCLGSLKARTTSIRIPYCGIYIRQADPTQDFRRNYGNPIMRMRDANATEKDLKKGSEANEAFTGMVNQILLRRTNEVAPASGGHTLPMARFPSSWGGISIGGGTHTLA